MYKTNRFHVERVAKTIALAGFLTNFCGAFVPGYMRGQSNFNFWQIAGKSAKFIVQLFSEIAENTKKAHVVRTYYYLFSYFK